MFYERRGVSSLSGDEYRLFWDNNEGLAKMYGRSMSLFRKNKADIDLDRINYEFVKRQEAMESSDCGEWTEVTIHNPYRLKIRPEKQIAAGYLILFSGGLRRKSIRRSRTRKIFVQFSVVRIIEIMISGYRKSMTKVILKIVLFSLPPLSRNWYDVIVTKIPEGERNGRDYFKNYRFNKEVQQ